MNSNLDCMFLHSPLDQYCNLFKGYKHCDKTECKVLDVLKENEQLKKDIIEIEKLSDSRWEENEQLKQQVSYLKDNLRVARKDREDLRDAIANGLEEFLKEKPFTSLRFLANKEVKEENEQLKEQNEKMKCCENCDGWDYLSTGEKDCIETCCSNRSNWRLRDRS